MDTSIPPFVADPVYSVKQRYFMNSTAADPDHFTVELPIVPWAISTNTTTLRPPFKSVRISKIKLWCVYRNSVGIEGNTVNLTILERRGVRPIEYSSTATYKDNACISKKFGKDNQLGWFYTQTSGETNPEFKCQMPKGALLEITFCFVMDDDDTMNSAAGSSLTADRVYTNQLSTKLSPVGKTYTAVISL